MAVHVQDRPAALISLFANVIALLQIALLQVADTTDSSPAKAAPVFLKVHHAAWQVMYGDTWRSSLTVDIGVGRFLCVERYSPTHVVAEEDLNSPSRDVAGEVLGSPGKGVRNGIAWFPCGLTRAGMVQHSYVSAKA
ncbi:hypothetical protein ACH4D5_13145 [Streptomyces sp. NPDC018029]|uniref:hypothetical protein n=1 Tax=Streptomyces sp. NPDC018029 TaxID=3365032 RepID=UPI0037B9913F